jgi:hypothetical protein
LEPPVFNIAEKLEYRNGVQRWAKLVSTIALVGNKEAKAVSASLNEALIASLPVEQQSLTKASVASVHINLNPMTFKRSTEVGAEGYCAYCQRLTDRARRPRRCVV